MYLISLIKNRGLDKSIVEAVRQNKVVYTGTSAGSMIPAAGLNMSIYDAEEKSYVAEGGEGKANYTGLGLLNFLIIPHASNKDFLKSLISRTDLDVG